MAPTTPQLAPEHLRFAVLAADVVLFSIKEGVLQVRLMNVDRPPHFSDTVGLPGGLIQADETAEKAAVRLLKERAGVSPAHVHLEQLYTFSRVDRDPRSRVVAVAYLGLVPFEKLSPQEQESTDTMRWVPVEEAKRLAYDHDEVLAVAIARLRSRVTYTTLIQQLLGAEFTLTELEQTYESVLATELDKRNFRKKILKLGVLKELPKKRTGVKARPAALYTFASKEVREIEVL